MTTKDTDTHSTPPATAPLALRLSEGLGPNAPLVERLRARRRLASVGRIGIGSRRAALAWITDIPDSDCAEAAGVIRQLSDALRAVLDFQSANDGPTIHDFGRWRRLVDDLGA